MKELESKLAERDAMIRVLQKKHHGHSVAYDKELHHTHSAAYDKHHSHSAGYDKEFLHHSPRSSELADDLVGPVSSGSVFTTSTGNQTLVISNLDFSQSLPIRSIQIRRWANVSIGFHVSVILNKI